MNTLPEAGSALAAAAISTIHDREKLNWLAKHCKTKGISPTVEQMAAMKLKGKKALYYEIQIAT